MTAATDKTDHQLMDDVLAEFACVPSAKNAGIGVLVKDEVVRDSLTSQTEKKHP